jgi:multidrug efflux pump subunit AcrB
MNARNQFLGMAAQSKILAGVRPNGVNDEPQYELTIDDEKASAQGISLSTSTRPWRLVWVAATSTTSSTAVE